MVWRSAALRNLCIVLGIWGAVDGREEALAAFEDRTSAAGLLWSRSSWGAALVDLDRDGDLDLYTGRHLYRARLFWNDGQGVFDPEPLIGSSDRHGVVTVPIGSDEFPDLLIVHGAGEPNELYRNDGPGAFSILEGAGGIDDPSGRPRAVSAADYDGDLLVDVWIGKAPSAPSPNSLFRGDGFYSFIDVAPSVGLDEPDGTVGGIWGDYDGDGDPDLFVGGEEFPRPSKLYRNNGGSFVDVTSVFSPIPPVVSGADWGDFDDDGDLDLAVSAGEVGIFDTFTEGDTLRYFFSTNYSEDGVDGLTIPSSADTLFARMRIRGVYDFSKTFLGPDAASPIGPFPLALTDEYVGAPIFEPGVDQGTWIWRQFPGGPWELRCSTPFVNFDNFDGNFTESAPIVGVTAHGLEASGFQSGGPRVWRNDGESFAEVTGDLGLPPAMVNPRHVSWVDYDNDGDLDLHIVDKGTSATPNAPDALFRNDGAVFVDVTASENVAGGTLGMGDGAVWGDIDRDGDLDVFIAQGGGPRAFGGAALLYRNDGTWGASLGLDLVGHESGPAALGAKVTAHVAGQSRVRRKSANSWRGFAQSGEIHIGLGAATSADSLVVEWPSGLVDVHRSVSAGFYRLDEGQGVLDAGVAVPRESVGWRIAAIHPQPARDHQSIELFVEQPVALEIAVYDLAGRLVRKLHRGPIVSGPVAVDWDGLDARGRRIAPGVYFLRATDGRSLGSAKSVWLR
jgi:hypothetical protein